MKHKKVKKHSPNVPQITYYVFYSFPTSVNPDKEKNERQRNPGPTSLYHTK